MTDAKKHALYSAVKSGNGWVTRREIAQIMGVKRLSSADALYLDILVQDERLESERGVFNGGIGYEYRYRASWEQQTQRFESLVCKSPLPEKPEAGNSDMENLPLSPTARVITLKGVEYHKDKVFMEHEAMWIYIASEKSFILDAWANDHELRCVFQAFEQGAIFDIGPAQRLGFYY